MKKFKMLSAVLVAALSLTAYSANLQAQTPPVKKPATEAKKMQKDTTVKVYTCPMHKEVISDKPGKCPKCGMKLVEKQMMKKQGMEMKKDMKKDMKMDMKKEMKKEMKKDSTMKKPVKK